MPERHIELLELTAPALHDVIEDVLVITDNLAVLNKFKRGIGSLGAGHQLAPLLDLLQIQSAGAVVRSRAKTAASVTR